ncbi:hypothetical protein HWV62_25768 [Athelia sp. TMB]|nr:hypothetical protein HWV62_25768 [Athelia sp. TMB]
MAICKRRNTALKLTLQDNADSISTTCESPNGLASEMTAPNERIQQLEFDTGILVQNKKVAIHDTARFQEELANGMSQQLDCSSSESYGSCQSNGTDTIASPMPNSEERESLSLTELDEGEKAGPTSDERTKGFYDLEERKRANVIVFGQTGTGKSSLVNMIIQKNVGAADAATSTSAVGCTTKRTDYDVDLVRSDGSETKPIKLWDTAGLNETSRGSVSTADAIADLYRLIQELNPAGISLLIYCVRGRIHETTVKNYNMCMNFCRRKVPIVLVVTGLEHEENRNDWWKENKQHFTEKGMEFTACACAVTFEGPEKKHAQQYRDSATDVQEMILDAINNSPGGDPCGPDSKSGFMESATRLMRVVLARPQIGNMELYRALISQGCSQTEARVKATIPKGVGVNRKDEAVPR